MPDTRNANFEHYFPICPNCKKLVPDSSEYSMSDKMCYECIHDLQVMERCEECNSKGITFYLGDVEGTKVCESCYFDSYGRLPND